MQGQQEQWNNHSRKFTVRLCGMSCSTCGYCSGKRASIVGRSSEESSKSYGLLIPSDLPAESYFKLMQRGWRRSGQHLYKPDNWDSCCPALTIRLPVAEFSPSKSQRRVIKKMQRALLGGSNVKKTCGVKKNQRRLNCHHSDNEAIPILDQLAVSTRDALLQITKLPEISQSIRYKVVASKDDSVSAMSTICAALSGSSKGKFQRGALATAVVNLLQDHSPALQIEAHEPSGQIKCKLSKQSLNMHPHTSHEDANDATTMDAENTPQDTLYDWFRSRVPQPPIAQHYNLDITTHTAAESSLQPDVHQLYFEYQQRVHNDPSPLADQEDPDWGDASPEYREQAESMLRTSYPDFTPEQIMNMTSSFSSFYRFLVESPLTTGEATGTFHQHYRINGTLIAVGVVDILPECLSSVYAFYDAEFAHSFCPLGKFLILKEIDTCQERNLPYYYLGYYIHSCEKMKYKAEYHPSQLLCPVTLHWVDALEGQATLDIQSPERNCCRLFTGDVTTAIDPTTNAESILLSVGLPNLITMSSLAPEGQLIVRPIVEEFLNHVGPEVGRDCVLRMV